MLDRHSWLRLRFCQGQEPTHVGPLPLYHWLSAIGELCRQWPGGSRHRAALMQEPCLPLLGGEVADLAKQNGVDSEAQRLRHRGHFHAAAGPSSVQKSGIYEQCQFKLEFHLGLHFASSLHRPPFEFEADNDSNPSRPISSIF